MPTQHKESDQQNVAALAAQTLGADPNAAPQQPPAAQPPAPNPPAVNTPADKVVAAGAPTTEADLKDKPPVKYNINFGEGDDRELSPEQISGTFERYGKLNDFNTQMRPIHALTAAAMKANPGLTPDKFAKALVAMSNKHNPQMGGADQRPNKNVEPGPEDASDISKQFEQWEKDNAASLPPGYRDMLSGSGEMKGQMGQMMKMMQQVLGRSQGQLDAAQSTAANAGQQNVSNAKQRIANNLAKVQQQLNLPDEAEQDFMVFASERGFTMEDFLDPSITLKLAQDFKNGIQSGEVARLKEIAGRRQSFSGQIPQQPGQSGAAGAPGSDPRLDALVDKRLGPQ